MAQPTEFVLLVSNNSSIRVLKKVVVQLHNIDLAEAFHMLKAGGHLSSAWSLEDFLSSVRSGWMPDLVEPIPAPVQAQKEGLIPFAFGDELIRAKLDSQGEPWFVAKDVCRVLDISNHNDALAALDDDEKGVAISDPLSPGGAQQVRTVSESGLYSLIFRSRKDEAKAFRRWVTSEVLPAIRRTGSYHRPMGPCPQEEKTDADAS